jgi:vacuolar-type H+-ATPase subunit E/Vma4
VNVERLRGSFLEMVSAELVEESRGFEAELRDRVAAARTDVEQLVAEARSAGERDAAGDVQRLVAGARRAARAEALAARNEIYEQLRAEVLTRVLALRSSAGYRRLLERLSSELKAQLGAGATLEVDPDPAGGVIARDGTRLVDCSLPVLARRCLAALGPQVEELWR